MNHYSKNQKVKNIPIKAVFLHKEPIYEITQIFLHLVHYTQVDIMPHIVVFRFYSKNLILKTMYAFSGAAICEGAEETDFMHML